MFQIKLYNDRGEPLQNVDTGRTQTDFDNDLSVPDITTSVHTGGSLKSYQGDAYSKYELFNSHYLIDVWINGRKGIASQNTPSDPSLWDIDVYELEQSFGFIPNTINILIRVEEYKRYYEGVVYSRAVLEDSWGKLSTIDTKYQQNYAFVEQQRVVQTAPFAVYETNDRAYEIIQYNRTKIEQSINFFESLTNPYKIRLLKGSQRFQSVNFVNQFGFKK